MAKFFAAAGAAMAAALAAQAHADALSTPSMTAPLSANPNPFSLDAGPFLGKVYVSGALSALGLEQSAAVPGDQETRGDVSNAQVFIQTTSGPVQFYVQAGAYSLPSLGAPYVKSGSVISDTFGVVPVAYVKIAPNATWSIEAGKLPTLIGAEYTFSFQNMNIERGLMWNQEPAVSRGVQVNYTKGKLSASVSLNDGFYSGDLTWLSGLLTYNLTANDVIAFAGGGSFETSSKVSFATPPAQNNGQIYNLIFTHTHGPWTLNPYVQYAYVPRLTEFGFGHSASSLSGGLLAKFSFTPRFALAGRVEYISTTGDAAQGAPNLLYGQGSSAWSFTVTPTWQYKVFFVRGEASYVHAQHVTPGDAFGPAGENAGQVRGLIETGVIF